MAAPDMGALGERSNEVRRKRSVIRTGMRNGSITLRDVLTDPDPVIHGLMISEVVLWTRGMTKNRMDLLNRCALKAHVNLMITVERSSTRTRDWCFENVPRFALTGPIPTGRH